MSIKSAPPAILVIDDDEDIRATLSAVFKGKGFSDLDTAVDGVAGLDRLEKYTSSHIVFIDLMMPNMNGWELLKEIEKRPKLSMHMIAIMSAAQPKPSDLKGYPFFPKPLDFNRMFEFCTRSAP